MTDAETVRAALRALLRLGLRYRYGGLGEVYAQAQRALQALDRLTETGWEQGRLALVGWNESPAQRPGDVGDVVKGV